MVWYGSEHICTFESHTDQYFDIFKVAAQTEQSRAWWDQLHWCETSFILLCTGCFLQNTVLAEKYLKVTSAGDMSYNYSTVCIWMCVFRRLWLGNDDIKVITKQKNNVLAIWFSHLDKLLQLITRQTNLKSFERNVRLALVTVFILHM